MKTIAPAILVLSLLTGSPATLPAANNAIVGWNNLGMHCMDSDYSVFSILPPYNTIHAQLIVGGKLVTNSAGYTVTYQAVADPDGSFNSTSLGKGNFYEFVQPLFGAALAVDTGLAGFGMPGPKNTPQSFTFDTPWNWFRAEGIPITPYDDGGIKNAYPLMRLIAFNAANQPLATNDIVLPVSDEMDCRACHASGTATAARPGAGWVWSDQPERDYRLNILRLHDERQFADHAGLYAAALSNRGFNPLGLYRGVVADGKPVLCAACHSSEALGTASYSNIPPLTASVHAKHATVMDPDLHIVLDSSANRAACYRCHPGSTTRCLRGAMGSAIAPDGAMAMQCQSCHGSMSVVGASTRIGWLNEPNCQSCHTGTATSNNGQIRYTSVFETNGLVRVPTNLTFATTPNAPAAGLSLFRFSRGHGGLECEACHGSTHAEFPSTHRNDNLRNIALQGHAGVTVECLTCHTTMPSTVSGGPHGLHPLGQTWVGQHGDQFESGTATRDQCRACHGSDYKGSVLARMQSSRTLTTESNYGTKNYWRGQQVTCYDCHNGPNSSAASANTPALVRNVSTNTTSGQPVLLSLPASDVNGNPLTFRIVSQPAHGSIGVSNASATYFPDLGFVGFDSFTFAAYDGFSDSNLGTGTVGVAQGPFAVTAIAHGPMDIPQGWPATFSVVSSASNLVALPQSTWDFGDASAPVSGSFPTHRYSIPGIYQWKVVSSVSSGGISAAATTTGSIAVNGPETLQITRSGPVSLLTWPRFDGDVLLETAPALTQSPLWRPDTNRIDSSTDPIRVLSPDDASQRLYRLRKL